MLVDPAGTGEGTRHGRDRDAERSGDVGDGGALPRGHAPQCGKNEQTLAVTPPPQPRRHEHPGRHRDTGPDTGPGRTPGKGTRWPPGSAAPSSTDFAIYGIAAASGLPDIFFPAAATRRDGSRVHLRRRLRRPPDRFVLHGPASATGSGASGAMIGTILLMGGVSTLRRGLPADVRRGQGSSPRRCSCRPRVLQGLSAAAGEQAGANSMSFEHAPDHRRGFFTSFTLQRHPGRPDLAPAVFVPLAALLSTTRAAVVGLADPVLDQRGRRRGRPAHRRRLEGPGSGRGRVRGGAERPLAVLFRSHWRAVLRVFLAAFIATVNTMFAVSRAQPRDVRRLRDRDQQDHDALKPRSSRTWSRSRSSPSGRCCRTGRIGRKPVFVTGVLGSAGPRGRLLGAIAHGQTVLMFVVGVALAGVVYSMPNAIGRRRTRVLPDPRPGCRDDDRHAVRLRPRRLHPDHRAGVLLDGAVENWTRRAVHRRRLRDLRRRGPHRPACRTPDPDPGDRRPSGAGQRPSRPRGRPGATRRTSWAWSAGTSRPR